jgi:hypothetical protein
MRTLLCLASAVLVLTACSNQNKNTAKTFCDTACQKDTLKFTENVKFNPTVKISFKNCYADTLMWTHDALDMSHQAQLSDYLGQDIKLNPSAINCVFKDTSYAWLTFNDCATGRGYLLKLPFNKKNQEAVKIKGALNSFDTKFSLAPDLRAYTDRGNIFVVDVNTGHEAQMSFKEAYDMDFNKIHDVIDSINVTHKRVYVKLLKDGKEIPLEKNIDL